MMPASFLRRSPLLLLAAALVALAVFFVAPGAQPAQAQTATTLSATLRATQPSSDIFGCTDTSTPGRSCTSRLTDTTFNHNGVSYEIDQLFNNRFNGNTLDFSLTTAIPASLKSALTLYLDDRPFALADATTITDGLRWSNAGLGWTAASTVKVVLTSLPAPVAATNLRVRPNDAALSLTWIAPTGTLTGYDVHYTSAAAGSVANDAAASGSNPAAAWVAVTRSGTTASQTIGSLTNNTDYRVRVRATNSGVNGAWVFGTGTPAAAGAPPAAATGTEGTLVSNTGQGQQTSVPFTNEVHAQAFTTGPYGDGYHLTGIEALLAIREALTSEDVATVRAELWSDSNGTPGTRVAYLTARNIPTGTATGYPAVTFTPSYGITVTLAANTTYHFVIYTTGSLTALDLLVTRSMADDAGAADGWSIADASSYLSSQNTPPWTPAWSTRTNAVTQIAVKGKPVSITHWASTLTVKDLGPLAGDGCIGQEQCSDQLAPGNSFTYGAWIYNVLAVRVVRGSLQLLLDRAPPMHPDQVRLDVGGRQFQFKDASESWGIDRNEDAWRLTWHGTDLSWSDGDTVPVSLVGWNVPAPPTPAPNTDLHPVRVHYDEIRDGEPVDNFNNLRLASPNPSRQPGRRVELRAYIPGTFSSIDPDKGIVTTTHVMLRVRAHPDSTLEWAIGNVYGVTGSFASFANGGFTPAIALNPASKWTYVYVRVTNGSQTATHMVAIDPPPRTYTLSPDVSVTEGEEAALSLSLGSPAGAGGVSFTVSSHYPDGGATAEDVGEIVTSVTVPEGQQSVRIIIPTVDDEAVEEDEERFTVRAAHVGEPAWAMDPEGTDAAVVTIVDNDEPPPPPEGPEPWDIRVVPGDGTLTVTWNVSSRDGVEDSEIWHVLRWSQEFGVWNNPRDPRAVGKNDGLSVDPGLTSYTITDLKNGVATGVFIRSMVGHRNNMSERDGNSSEWVRTKGEHTTPVAPPNDAPTVSAGIADATITNESGTHEVSLAGVFSDGDGDALTITAASSDTAVATVSVAADYSTLTVSAQARGTTTVTVTAADGNGGSVEDSFSVSVKAAPAVASAIADVSGLEAEDSRTISMSGVFSDADGDTVTVTQASSSDTSIAAVSAAIDGATAAITAITVIAKSEGTATITVTARDSDGNTVQDAFDVTVNAPAAQQQKVNNAPTVSGAIADATIINETGMHEVSLSGVFSDVDGDELTITAASSDELLAIGDVATDYSMLRVLAMAQGIATITVTASDGNGNAVADSFTVRVKAAPVVASAIADVSGLEAGDSRTVSLSGVFRDADGDSLTVTATSSDEGKATVSVAADRSALTVSGVAVGTATITVTAQDADGNSVSDAFRVEVVPVPEPEPVELPGPVLGLELTATHDSVSVSWSAPESGDAPDGYIVHLRPEGGDEGSGRTKTPRADKTTVTFNNLESGQTYRVWVRAENEAGKGERVRASITLPSVLPGPVTGLEVAATGDGVTVSWSAPETGGAPDGYIVHLKPEDGESGSGRTKTPKAKKTKVSFENLEAGRTYKVWVRAQNDAGKGERVHATITLPEAEPPPEDDPPRERPPEDTPPPDDGGGQEQGEDQTIEPALVSNFGQERRVNDWPTNNFVLSQAFTTGNAATTLESVDVSIRETLNVSHIATVRAELWSTAEGGGPGEKLVDLVVPDVMEEGDVAFAAPAGTALAANTTYHFVLYTTGRVDLRVVATYSEDEDAGGEDGWSIADATHHIRAQTPEDGDWVEVTVSGVMLIRVEGQDADNP